MRRAIIIAICVLLGAIPTFAYGAGAPQPASSQKGRNADGLYVSANAGVALLRDSALIETTVGKMESGTGMTSGLALGYRKGQIRIEEELSYQKNDIDKITFSGTSRAATGDRTAASLLLNGYYDFVNAGSVTPFIGGGIGYTRIKENDAGYVGQRTMNRHDTVFAFQLSAGLGYAIDNRTSLDLVYRYFRASNPQLGATEEEYRSNNIMIGIRYNF